MRRVHHLLLLSLLGLGGLAACVPDTFIATAADGGSTGEGSSSSGGSTGSGGSGGSTGSSSSSGTSSGSGSEEGGTGRTACTANGDCPTNEICGFPESSACAATGQCFPAPAAVCQAYSAGCACDGTEINVACTGLPAGYASSPLLHAGPCTGSDAGPARDSGTDSGGAHTACSTNADCAPNNLCGFLETAACTAKGACFPAALVTCASYGAGCACDGSEINISCNGLPAGYGTKPLLHAGACADAGPAKDSGTVCASALGGHCGGNIVNPCTCQAGLVCTPGDGGVPFGDVGGTCELADAGGTHASCTASADCTPNEICGFPQSQACAAQGECFPAPMVTCQAISFGCACDGTEVNTVCNGLPGGYETKPLLHTGPCGTVADASLGCTGPAPNCFGNNDQLCCGQDPSGIATCQNGAWMCGSVAAPGCNGSKCLQLGGDASAD